MKISKITNVDTGTRETNSLAMHLDKLFGESRFNVVVEIGSDSISLKKIRLKTSKLYCGNHPNACEIGGERSRRGLYLEGADWVEFNDCLNNLLDRLRLSANISSSVCIIRKYTKRRTVYDSFRVYRNYQWYRDEPDDCWVNNIGGSPMISEFPEGTPGIYEALRYSEVG
jgi:hypothetical protein